MADGGVVAGGGFAFKDEGGCYIPFVPDPERLRRNLTALAEMVRAQEDDDA